MAKVALVCDAWQGDGVIMVQRDGRIKPPQANGRRQGDLQTTERSHLWPRGAGRRRLPRLIGGSVFHVGNVAVLISAGERAEDDLDDLDVACWGYVSVHLNRPL